MGFRHPVQSKTMAQLARQANPQAVAGGQSEALPWILYDTQPVTTGVTVQLTFFGATVADRTLSNMPAGGQLPDPQFFEVYYFGFDVLQPVTSTATGVTGAWDNVQNLVMDQAQRPTWEFTISDKRIGPFPLSFCHTSGGVTGFGFNEAAAGTVKSEYANNAIPDGGFCAAGAITIPPKVSFDVVVNYAAAPVIIGGPIQCRFWMAGTLHRRVL